MILDDNEGSEHEDQNEINKSQTVKYQNLLELSERAEKADLHLFFYCI